MAEFMIGSAEWRFWRVALILFAIIVPIVIFEVQRRKIKELRLSNRHSAIVVLMKRHAGDPDYAGTNKIIRVDGLKTEEFLYCVGVPAVYLSPGEHDVEVESRWVRRNARSRSKEYHAGPRHMYVEVKRGEFWSLEYRISDDKFLFTKCDEEKLFKRA